MSISEIIFEYLQTNRRITLPAMGTFLSKGDATPLLFSEFMKSDDGVLRELLASKAGMSELEAAIFVDRFVFDLRHTVESGERFTMPHLGYIYSQDGQSYIFDYDPTAEEVIPEPEAQEEQTEEQTEEQPTDREVAEQESEEAEAAESSESSTEATTNPEPSIAARVIEQMESDGGDRSESEAGSVESLYQGETEMESEPEAGHGGVDWWIIAAIVMLLVAIGAVLYGLFVEWLTGGISFGEPIDGWLESLLVIWEDIFG